MNDLLDTPAAANLLRVKPMRLNWIVWSARIPEPCRIGKNFAWGWPDLERAAHYLHGCGVDDLLVSAEVHENKHDKIHPFVEIAL
jgi:hypothetical protein